MKKIIFILSGASLLGVAGYFLIGIFANWYGPQHIKNDEDISTLFLYSLLALVVFIGAGGFGGWTLFNHLSSRATGPARKRASG